MSDQGTVCECGRRWTGYRECHCRVCHRHFAGVEAFDAHLKGSDKSLEHIDPPAKRGYRLLERGSGPTWGQEMDQAALNRLTRTRKQDSDGIRKSA